MKSTQSTKHKLDELVDRVRRQSDLEGRLEGRRNTFVETHPFIVGYAFLAVVAGTLIVCHLTALAISFLFIYFISDLMTGDIHRAVPFLPRAVLFSLLYTVVVLAIIVLSYKVVPMMLKNLPELSNQLRVQVVKDLKDAAGKGELAAYVNVDQLKGSIIKASADILHFLATSLTPLYKGFIQFIFALAINLFFYFESDKVEQAFTRNPNSLMTFLFQFSQTRLKIFYIYFRRVMGGQVIIALINTLISLLVIFGLHLRHPFLMVFVVFFCGLFPVVGNLMSNCVLTINAFVVTGAWGMVICLIMLVAVHKLEYFLNSRIIGGIVNMPMAICLGALIFCEVLLGIAGLILAIPLVLFVRHELENIRAFSSEPVEGGPVGALVGEEVKNRAAPMRKIV
ncbi:MAG: AI-2E family transporter [Syntrophobacteraceae bacterium]